MQNLTSEGETVGWITPAIVLSDSAFLLNVIGLSILRHIEIEEYHINVGVCLKGVKHSLSIALVVYNILIREEDDVAVCAQKRVVPGQTDTLLNKAVDPNIAIIILVFFKPE